MNTALIKNLKEVEDGTLHALISPHILLILENGENSVYVCNGKEEGWHDFKTKNETMDYLEKLTEGNIDFILNPNW